MSTTTRPTQEAKRPRAKPIIGGVIGGMVSLVLVFTALWVWYRRLQKEIPVGEETLPQPFTTSESEANRPTGGIYGQKIRGALMRNPFVSSAPPSRIQPSASSPSVPSSTHDIMAMNTRLGELTAELQALRAQLQEDQGSISPPPPSYVTRPMD